MAFQPIYFHNVMYFYVIQNIKREKNVGQDLLLSVKNLLECKKWKLIYSQI